MKRYLILTALLLGIGIYFIGRIAFTNEHIQKVAIPAQKIISCDQFRHTKFQSVIKYPGGLSANGKISEDYETLSFEDKTFFWTHSDLVESGTYICKDNVLTATFQEFKRTLTASFTTNTQILSWWNHDYHEVQ